MHSPTSVCSVYVCAHVIVCACERVCVCTFRCDRTEEEELERGRWFMFQFLSFFLRARPRAGVECLRCTV